MTAATLAHGTAWELENLAGLIRAEFDEMPCMQLSFAQVRRFWNLSDDECHRILDQLVCGGVLRLDAQHRYCRRH